MPSDQRRLVDCNCRMQCLAIIARVLAYASDEVVQLGPSGTI
jgi:hypothetical protein